MYGEIKTWIVTTACAMFFGFFLCNPIRSYACGEDIYFGTNEDYLLSGEKPDFRAEGHYLEFVFDENYTVEPGDTLWGIAESYCGNGAYYGQIMADNADVAGRPKLLMPGTQLRIRRNLYTSAGLDDYINSDVFQNDMLVDDPGAFTMEDFIAPYRIFASVPYVNDLQEADPYAHWEEFQAEVRKCSEQVCGGRVSGLSFERCQVTGVGPLCSYSFSFDAEGKEYIIIACICYSPTTKSEAYALCDMDYCTETELKEAKGKAFYAAVTYLNPGIYYVKTQDYVGGEDWKYPQLRNPFTDAMHCLYTGPLVQVKDYSDMDVIIWKEPAFEQAVREELARLWQLTPAEKEAFMERDMTVSDLSQIEEILLVYRAKAFKQDESLCVQLNGYEGSWYNIQGTEVTAGTFGSSGLLTTLDDLRNFPQLKCLDINMRGSSITDFSCIGELTQLRILRCDIWSESVQIESVDFLGSLVNLRTLLLGGWQGGRFTNFFGNVRDLSVLRNCPRLAYLTLLTGNVKNYDFLGDLPEIYYFRLNGSGNHSENIVPDIALLPNACFVELYGDSVRFEVGDGYAQ